MSSLLEQLQASPLSAFLSQNAYAFPVLEILHVLSISLVLGSVVIFDLRLLNLSWRGWPAARLLAALLPVTVGGFVAAAISGALLFASHPIDYLKTAPFLAKLAFLAAAGANAGLFHLWFGRHRGAWTERGAIPLPARVSALVSLSLWGGVLVLGRFIGFVLVKS